EQSRNRHDHAALAVAALRHVVVDPRLLHLVQLAVLGEPLDGGDLLAGRVAHRKTAGAYRLAVEVYCAGAALRDAAAVLGAGHSDRVADDPQERRIWFDVDLVRLAVDRQCYHSFLLVTVYGSRLTGAAGGHSPPYAASGRDHSLI